VVKSARRIRLRAAIGDYTLLITGALLLAVNLNLFLVPANIAPGGVSGIAIILNSYSGWPIGMIMLVLNVPLTLLGFRFLGGLRFLTRTILAVVVYSVGADLLALWLPATGITGDVLLNALYGGVVGGIGTGLVYRGGGTTAGSGTLSRIIQNKTGIPISQIYLLIDGGIVVVAGLVFGWEAALYALITLFVWGIAADYVLEGPSVVRTVFIVTDAPRVVADAVSLQMHLGVTSWAGQGMFTDAPHTILFCTISRPGVRQLRQVVMQADPDAFVVIGQAHQASGGMLGLVRRSRREKPAPETQSEHGAGGEVVH
jgi:uncharacterized membrane-anchored protein YitT (DUF2179 family)